MTAAPPGSDLIVQVAVATGLVSLALTVGLVLQVLWMRRLRRRRQARADSVLEAWRPIVYGAALDGALEVRPLEADDEVTVLLLWNQVQDGLRGPPREGLNQLARAIGARAMAVRRLRGGSALERLLSLRTLGYLGEPQDFDRILPWLDEPRVPLSVAAARALTQIDPRRATDAIWDRLRLRLDWPLSQLASVLRGGDLRRLAAAFIAAAPDLGPAELQRLLPLLAVLDPTSSDQVVASLLDRSRDPDVLTGALRHVHSAALLPSVLRLTTHDAWPVRTQAAAALGRVGGLAHLDRVLILLSDPQWWVRYRAAQALLAGRFGGRRELAARARELPDRFARDMVAHVLAEARP